MIRWALDAFKIYNAGAGEPSLYLRSLCWITTALSRLSSSPSQGTPTLHLQNIAVAGDHFVEYRIYEEPDE